MNEGFDDIFETINVLHKKYSSKEYIEKTVEFDKSGKEVAKILEKYRIKRIPKKKKKENHGHRISNKKRAIKL